jgi:hypothetical protein
MFDIWTNELRNVSVSNDPNHIGRLNENDDPNIYDLNSYGYRSPEFTSNTKFIAAGCSMTFGEGVPENATWGKFLASDLGLADSYANLGIRGGAIGQIVLNVFAYIKKYGAPKYLFCLFPNVQRMEFVFHKDMVLDQYGVKVEDFSEDYIVSRTHLNQKNVAPPKYLKSPVYLQDIMPLEHSIFQSMGYIDILTIYCEAAGITFRWSTWDRNLANDLAGRDYKNYLDVISTHSKVNLDREITSEDQCHNELSEVYGKNFYVGLDSSLHWGVHKHLHMAEKFLASIDRDILYTG